ncbi:ABC transporter permease [Millisia brevis]|uniref:ABC transporter permease n=1 Tax=Millisia brevis TaxID=264148 RepID=UPI0008315E2F|nr:ABC transporter permease [Millisia brevis]
MTTVDTRSGSGRTRSRALVLGALIPVGALLLWQIVTALRLIDPLFMPAPAAVVTAFGEWITDGGLAEDMSISLQRAALGFVLGGGLGVIVGVLTGFSAAASRLLDPSLQVVRLTPTLAIAPLLVLWFGFGELSKVVLIASLAFFPLYMSVHQGIRQVGTAFVEVGRVLEFSRWDHLRLILGPAALPYLFTGLRLSLGVSWIGLIVAEITGSQSGVGHLIIAGQTQNRTDLVFVGIAIFALMGWLIDRAVTVLQRRVLRWNDSHSGF